MKYLLHLLALLLLFSSWLGQEVKGQSLPAFTGAAESMMRQAEMKHASVGICVRDLQTGQILYAYDSDRTLVTASTMKAITTASALSILGPDFRFETLLALDGQVKDGILYGDLVIVGKGDPTLGSDRIRKTDAWETLLYDWALLIKASGVKEIKGAVIGDDSYMSSQLTPGNWGWEDIGNYYGAGAGALNIHENYYQLDFSSSSQPGGDTKILRTVPEMPLFFVNEVTAGKQGSGDNAYIFGSPYTQVRYVRGTIPPNRTLFSIKGAMPDPALFCAQQLSESLKTCGIEVGEAASTARLRRLAGKPLPRQGSVVHTHFSAPLSEIAKMTNYFSVNLYAEALARRIAVARGREGISDQGANAMKDHWTAQGVNTRGMRLQDGSGLSPNNALTTKQVVDILYLAGKGPIAASFLESLPVAGESGALKSRMTNTSAKGRVRAKSGYIDGVRGYVGYADLPDGRRVAFAFLANHFEGSASDMQARWETLMVKLAEGR